MLAGDRRHGRDQRGAHDRIVLRLCAVGDVAGAEVAELGRDRLQVAERLAQQHERAEQHRFLLCHFAGGEERSHVRGGREQARVEDVHQLVAARGDEVEARFERFQIEVHGISLVSVMRSVELRAGAAPALRREPPTRCR